jgi:hypothetical protein
VWLNCVASWHTPGRTVRRGGTPCVGCESSVIAVGINEIMFPAWSRGRVHRSGDFVPAKLITYVDDAGRSILASVWSEAPRGALWVVPLDAVTERAFVRVRRLARKYVIDNRTDGE